MSPEGPKEISTMITTVATAVIQFGLIEEIIPVNRKITITTMAMTVVVRQPFPLIY